MLFYFDVLFLQATLDPSKDLKTYNNNAVAKQFWASSLPIWAII